MKKDRTELQEVGEFGLIDRLNRFRTSPHTETITAGGDDAAVLSITDDEAVLLSTDMLVEGIHFDLSFTPLEHLGYKSVAVNASDLAAMNALPSHIVVSVGLSNRFSVEAVEALYSGIAAACEAYDIDLVGGDTTSSRSGLIVNITIYGRAPKSEIVYRKGAQKNDLLVVTGDLGAAYVGLQVLNREKAEWLENPDMTPQLDTYSYVVGRQLRPQARLDVVREFKKLGLQPTSMIDISDGLASEILHLHSHNNVGFRIYEEKLPIDPMTYHAAREFDLDPTVCMLSGGEDYELLFTIPVALAEAVEHHPDFTVIGHVTGPEEKPQMISKGGHTHLLQAQGWLHF
jgi:thiamine-monophosphate kinase